MAESFGVAGVRTTTPDGLSRELAAALLAFFVAQAILRQHHVQTTFGSPHVARAVIGSALFLTVVVLLLVNSTNQPSGRSTRWNSRNVRAGSSRCSTTKLE